MSDVVKIVIVSVVVVAVGALLGLVFVFARGAEAVDGEASTQSKNARHIRSSDVNVFDGPSGKDSTEVLEFLDREHRVRCYVARTYKGVSIACVPTYYTGEDL